jgi:hypothetical protein
MGNVCGTSAEAVDSPATAKPVAASATKEPAVANAEPTDVKQSAAPADEKKDESPAEEVPKVPKKLKVRIIFYSMYGHIYTLASTYKAALETLEDVEVDIYQVGLYYQFDLATEAVASDSPDVVDANGCVAIDCIYSRTAAFCTSCPRNFIARLYSCARRLLTDPRAKQPVTPLPPLIA